MQSILALMFKAKMIYLDDYMITELDNTIAKGASVDVEDVIQDEEELRRYTRKSN
jgi:hypothetical protein